MNPAEYLALLHEPVAEAVKPASATGAARAYRALETSGAAEYLITLHTQKGMLEALAYGGLQLISADRGGTQIRLKFGNQIVRVSGQQLAPVFEALRTRRAAHLYEFSGGRHDPPEPGQPVITEIGFREHDPKAKPAAAAGEAARPG